LGIQKGALRLLPTFVHEATLIELTDDVEEAILACAESRRRTKEIRSAVQATVRRSRAEVKRSLDLRAQSLVLREAGT